MSKYLLTKNNIPFDNEYKNIPYFSTELERDIWINETLFDGEDYKLLLDAQPEVGIKKLTPLTYSLKILKYDNTYINNMIIIKDKIGNIDFCFIESIENVKNNKVFDINVKVNISLTYFNVINMMKNLSLYSGHSDSKNYLENSYDLSSKVVDTITPLVKKTKNTIEETLSNTSWLVVIEESANTIENLFKIKNLTEIREPFKVYIAPLSSIEEETNGSTIVPIFHDDTEGYTPTITYNKIGNPPDVSFDTISLLLTIPNDSTHVRYRIEHSDPNEFNTSQYDTNIPVSYIPQTLGEKKFIIINSQSKFDQTHPDIYSAEYLNDVLNNNGIINFDVMSYLTTNMDWINFIWLEKIGEQSYRLTAPLMTEVLERIPNLYYSKGSGVNIKFQDLYNEEPVLNNWYSPFSNVYQIKYWDAIIEGVWTSNELINYVQTNTSGRIVTVKKTNFNPLITYQESGIFNLNQVENIIKEGDKNIYRLSYINYNSALRNNVYSYKLGKTNDLGIFEPISNIEKIKGIFPYEVVYENNKTIEIDTNYISEDGTISLVHYASFTPEWEERTKFFSNDLIELTNENNAWQNSKEFVKGKTDLAAYKATSPITSNPFFQFGGSLVSRPLSLLNPLTAAATIIGGSAGTVINRQEMKKQPEHFSGSGDALGDSIFNVIGDRFAIVKYKFIGSSRDFIKKSIHRNGITYNTGINFDTYNDIKRPYFNFVALQNVDDSLNNLNLSIEVYEEFKTMFEEGVRIWNVPNKVGDFEVNNGD